MKVTLHPRMSVYPRMCGVDLTLIVVIGILSGLSPHVRGRCGGTLPDEDTHRFIPACAG